MTIESSTNQLLNIYDFRLGLSAIWNYDDKYAYDFLNDFDNVDHNGRATLFELLNFLRNLNKSKQ